MSKFKVGDKFKALSDDINIFKIYKDEIFTISRIQNGGLYESNSIFFETKDGNDGLGVYEEYLLDYFVQVKKKKIG